MSTRYLLDTNVVSEPLRPRPHPGVVERLRAHADRLATAATVWHELHFGLARLPASKKRDAIERYLAEIVAPSIEILPYDAAAARWHAAERARLAAAGLTPPFRDGQIAAVAAVHDLVVVTANVSDFASFSGITVEDWTAA